MVVDCFPFYNELDVLEIRLNELSGVVDRWVILESEETYGGHKKPLFLKKAMSEGRFAEFAPRITRLSLDKLEPVCADRTTGRMREAYQRNMIAPALAAMCADDDAVIFSDCDEIPSERSVRIARGIIDDGPVRFKQTSFYYTVNRVADYGNDFASRARIGTWKDVRACGSMYEFRMYKKNELRGVEKAGWHFGYFGGVEHIKNKVATMSPFLSEYKLFGDQQLVRDILNGKDLHHRRTEMPETFEHRASDDQRLPKYFLENRAKFEHFTEDYYKRLS